MATRSRRRQVRLINADRRRHRRTLTELDDRVMYDIVQLVDEPPYSFTRLIICFNRWQRVQQVLMVICQFTLWIPLIIDTFSRPFIDAQRWNMTPEVPSSMRVDVWSDLNSESMISWMILVCCVGAAVCSIRSQLLKLNNPIISSFNGRQLLIPLICSSICNQLATGMIARPWQIITDLRFSSILIVQIIGFVFTLYSAFIFGVLHVGYPGVQFSSDQH